MLAPWKKSYDQHRQHIKKQRCDFPYKDSVQFSHSVVSYSLWPHGPQHTRPPCPSPTPRVHPNPCPFSQWCHPTISSSVIPFSFCPQSFPASGSFPLSQLFASDGQRIRVSSLASVLPMNTQDWSPLRMDWLDLLAVQGTLKSLLQHHGFISMQFYNFLCCGHAYSLFDLFLGPWYSLILLYMVSFSLFMFPRYLRASLIAQTVKNQPAMRETWNWTRVCYIARWFFTSWAATLLHLIICLWIFCGFCDPCK